MEGGGPDHECLRTEWKGETFESKHKEELLPEVMEYLSENREHRKVWKGVPISRDGKVRLRDAAPANSSTAPSPSDTCIT